MRCPCLNVPRAMFLLLQVLGCIIAFAWTLECPLVHRRTMLLQSQSSLLLSALVGPSLTMSQRCCAVPLTSTTTTTAKQGDNAFVYYSPNWTGTRIPWLSLSDAIQNCNIVQTFDEKTGIASAAWEMGRWPDPVLRRS